MFVPPVRLFETLGALMYELIDDRLSSTGAVGLRGVYTVDYVIDS